MGSKEPKIRFRGFTDPWEQRKLGDIAPITMGQSPDGSCYTDNPADAILVQGNADLVDGWVVPRVWTTQITKSADAGDLIMSVRAPVGAMGKTQFNVVLGRGVCGIKGNEFVYQALTKYESEGFWSKVSAGSTFESINTDALKETSISVPGQKEQDQIGGFFAEIDNLITLHQREFSVRLDTKAQGIGIPAWEQRKFADIVDVCSGRDYKHLDEGEIPVYGTGGYMTSVCEALSYDKDAIGIGRKGTIDKPYILKAPFWTVDTLFYSIPRPGIDLDFANCAFLNIDWAQKDESTGLPSLSKQAINETELFTPSADEQCRIGTFFSELDNLITLHQRD